MLAHLKTRVKRQQASQPNSPETSASLTTATSSTTDALVPSSSPLSHHRQHHHQHPHLLHHHLQQHQRQQQQQHYHQPLPPPPPPPPPLHHQQPATTDTADINPPSPIPISSSSSSSSSPNNTRSNCIAAATIATTSNTQDKKQETPRDPTAPKGQPNSNFNNNNSNNNNINNINNINTNCNETRSSYKATNSPVTTTAISSSTTFPTSTHPSSKLSDSNTITSRNNSNNSNNNSSKNNIQHSYLISQLLQKPTAESTNTVYSDTYFNSQCHPYNRNSPPRNLRKFRKDPDVKFIGYGLAKPVAVPAVAPQNYLPPHSVVTLDNGTGPASAVTSHPASLCPPAMYPLSPPPPKQQVHHQPLPPQGQPVAHAGQNAHLAGVGVPVNGVDVKAITPGPVSAAAMNGTSTSATRAIVDSNNVQSKQNVSKEKQLWKESSQIEKVSSQLGLSYAFHQMIVKIYNRACTLPEFSSSKMRSPMIAASFYAACEMTHYYILVQDLCQVCGVTPDQLKFANSIFKRNWSKIQLSMEPSDYNVVIDHKSASVNGYNNSQHINLQNASILKSSNSSVNSTVTHHHHPSDPRQASHHQHHHHHPSIGNSALNSPKVIMSHECNCYPRTGNSKIPSNVSSSTSSSRRSPFYLLEHNPHASIKAATTVNGHELRSGPLVGPGPGPGQNGPLAPPAFIAPSKYTESANCGSGGNGSKSGQVRSGHPKHQEASSHCLSMPTAASLFARSLSPPKVSTPVNLHVDEGPKGSGCGSAPAATAHYSSNRNVIIRRPSSSSSTSSSNVPAKSIVNYRNSQGMSMSSSSCSSSPSPSLSNPPSVSPHSPYAQLLDMAALTSSCSLAANMSPHGNSAVGGNGVSGGSSSVRSSTPTANNNHSSYSLSRATTVITSTSSYPSQDASFAFAADQPHVIRKISNPVICYPFHMTRSINNGLPNGNSHISFDETCSMQPASIKMPWTDLLLTKYLAVAL